MLNICSPCFLLVITVLSLTSEAPKTGGVGSVQRMRSLRVSAVPSERLKATMYVPGA